MSKQRQRGTSFESSLIPLLSRYMPQTHRLGAQGAKDCGDFWTPDPRYVIEAKCEASYAGKLSGYLSEAEAEAANAGKPHGIVVFKRHGTRIPARQYVVMTLETHLELAHGEPF